MAKNKNKKRSRKTIVESRNAIALAAILRKGGHMQDGRKKRNRTRKSEKTRAIHDSQD